MKEQRITFETAKLAKEKGFDLTTGSNCWIKTLDEKIIHNSDRKNNNPLHDRTLDYYLAQPTQALLQKWLREVHNIQIQNHFLNSKYAVKIKYDINKSENVYNKDTYEEALEIGLYQALQLI